MQNSKQIIVSSDNLWLIIVHKTENRQPLDGALVNFLAGFPDSSLVALLLPQGTKHVRLCFLLKNRDYAFSLSDGVEVFERDKFGRNIYIHQSALYFCPWLQRYATTKRRTIFRHSAASPFCISPCVLRRPRIRVFRHNVRLLTSLQRQRQRNMTYNARTALKLSSNHFEGLTWSPRFQRASKFGCMGYSTCDNITHVWYARVLSLRQKSRCKAPHDYLKMPNLAPFLSHAKKKIRLFLEDVWLPQYS